MSLLAGNRIGPFLVQERLGAGGMGEVYRARDAKLERDIALKILGDKGDDEHIRRFEQEARAASALNHPNIVTIYEIGSDRGVAYIAMELIEGENLRYAIARGDMTLKKAMRIACRIADGLAAAHERGIVHRDLKPENVMLSSEGFVKILDFGLAKLSRPVSATDVTMEVTAPGVVFGTMAYMSPEQASGRRTDFRSDQFSFGAMLHELVTGKPLFRRNSAAETLAAILREDPRPLREVDPSVPPELDRIVSRCLAKEPDERYGSTRDLARDLREVRDSLTRPGNSSDRLRSGSIAAVASPVPVLALAAGIVVALVAAGIWMSLRTRPVTGIGTSVSASTVAGEPALPQDPALTPADQRRLAEAVGMLHRSDDAGAVNAAIDRLESLLVNARDSAVINGFLGRAYLASYRETRKPALLEQATLYSERAVQLDGRQPDARVSAGELYLTKGRNSDAEREFREALKSRADHPGALLGLADAMDALGRAADAERHYERVMSLYPAWPTAYARYGRFCYSRGRYLKAASLFETLNRLVPDSPRPITNLGAAYQAMGKHDEAVAAYQRALELRPTAASWSNLGSYQYFLLRFDDAARSFEQAVRLSPANYLLWANAGDALRWSASGRDRAATAYERSIDLARKDLEINPRNALARAVIASSLAKLGRLAEARQEIDAALRVNPTDADVLYHAAVTAVLRGDGDAAVLWLQSAAKAGSAVPAVGRDPEFRPLQSRSDFKELLRSSGAAQKEM